jgi:hypothetical protein
MNRLLLMAKPVSGIADVEMQRGLDPKRSGVFSAILQVVDS